MDPCNICYTGTHDNDTVIGWLTGGSGDSRTPEEIEQTRAAVLERVGGALDGAHVKLLKLALASPARVVIAPVQDLLGLGSAARLNTPGIAGGNWRWRLQPEMLTPGHSETIRDMVREAQRARLVSKGNDNRP
jgi:4-alpha-glucanotransferase